MRKTRRLQLALIVALTVVPAIQGIAAGPSDLVRVGIVADVHAHDTDSPGELKVMTNYAERLTAFIDAMTAWPSDLVVELGDLVNGAFVLGPGYGDPDRILQILDDAVALFSALECPVHYVLGNHDLYDLSKNQFLAAVGREEKYYSFDLGGYHFVMLDAEYNDPGEADYDHVFMRVKCRIPQHELNWLRDDLANTAFPAIVCVHQPFDAEYDRDAGGPPVVNNVQVMHLLSGSDAVIAVFQGHTHESSHTEIDGIHYVTFAAMVDHALPTPPSWAAVTLDPSERTITIDGEGLQDDLVLNY